MFINFLTYLCLHGLISISAPAGLSTEEHEYPRFIAAQKGDHPPCALKPGETFCEEVDYYPQELILNAIKNSKFDVTKFLINESEDEGPDLSFLRSATNVPKASTPVSNFPSIVHEDRIMPPFPLLAGDQSDLDLTRLSRTQPRAV